jgi:hypothetical protein
MMAVVAGLFGIMTEDAFSLCEIPYTECLLMGCPPSFQRSVKFRARDAPSHLHCQRTFASHFRFLYLLTTDDHK